MRVALVAGEFRPRLDGVSDYTARLAAALAGDGVRPVILGGRGAEADAGGAPEVRGAVARWDARGVRALARELGRARADVVHVQFSPTAYGWRRAIGLLPLQLGERRLVTTLHEHGSWRPRPAWLPEPAAAAAWRALGRAGLDRETLLLARASAALITTNPLDHARLGGRPALIPVPAMVACRAMDRAAARAALRERIGAPPQAEVVAFFGFLHPIKGLGHLFAAAARLRARRPELRLVLIGGFDSLALPAHRAASWPGELRALAARHGLAEAVTFTGHVAPAEVSALLQGADAAALTSDFGTTTKSSSLMTVLEHGLPTVATRGEDPALEDGRHVVLVAPKDAAALADALERVLADGALRARLRTQGRGLTASWEEVARAHRRLYERLAAPRTAHRPRPARRRGAVAPAAPAAAATAEGTRDSA